MGPTIPDKPAQFRIPRLNRYREIPPEAIGAGIFDGVFCDNFRPEVVRDVIPGVDVVHIAVDIHIFGDSRSNCSRDIRLPYFVTDDERTNERRQRWTMW